MRFYALYYAASGSIAVARCGLGGQFTGRETTPVLWKQGIAVTRDIFTRFETGERDAHISPKYARVGWNNFWKNDEWWVERQIAQR